MQAISVLCRECCRVGACRRVKCWFDSINKILFGKANRSFVLSTIPARLYTTHNCRVTVAVVLR